MSTKVEGRQRRKLRIRKKISGTTARPRLSVFRSARHIYAQVIDDTTGTTMVSVSTLSKELREAFGGTNKTEAAKRIGATVAEQCRAKSIDSVVFDRNGYLFHGRIKALADAARAAGLQF